MQNSIYDLMKLLTSFQGVERAVVVPGSTRKENDTEHSYNLALAAWLIIEKDKLPLQIDLCVKYALVHDLVEVYAGDSFALDPAQVAQKADKELSALHKLESDQLTRGLAGYIKDYESMASEEAKFIYSLDKLLPAFGILYGGELIWKNNLLSPKDWADKFADKIKLSKYTAKYLDFVLTEQKKRPELFAEKKHKA